MKFKQVLDKCHYGAIGYIGSNQDLEVLKQLIEYNLDILKQFKGIIVASTFKDSIFIDPHTQLWKSYFPNCVIINTPVNRGLGFGTCDNDNAIFDYCKKQGIKWLCKGATDLLLAPPVYEIEVDEADFYYTNGIGYGGMEKYNFDYEIIIKETFFPQANFYVINVSKCDYLIDKDRINKLYETAMGMPNYKYPWQPPIHLVTERITGECVTRNNLKAFDLLSKDKFIQILDFVKNYKIVDPSHKNMFIEGICHYGYVNEQVIVL